MARTIGYDSTNSRLTDGKMYLSDVVKHLIVTCSLKGIVMPTNHKPWHSLFYEAKKIGGAPASVKEAFFESDTYSRCRHLDNCLGDFMLVGILRTESPKFNTYNINEDTKLPWSTELQSTPRDYQAFINTLSEMARNEFRPYLPVTTRLC
jgi:hypothetical protein